MRRYLAAILLTHANKHKAACGGTTYFSYRGTDRVPTLWNKLSSIQDLDIADTCEAPNSVGFPYSLSVRRVQ